MYLGCKYEVVFKEGKFSWFIYCIRKVIVYVSNGKRKFLMGIKKKKVMKCYFFGDLMVIL